MNIEIADEMFERTKALASKLNCNLSDAALKIFRRGLQSFDGITEPGQSKGSRSTNIEGYIRDNWTLLSDKEMARVLSVPFYLVQKNRLEMKLYHHIGRRVPDTSISKLTSDDRSFIETHLDTPNEILSVTLNHPTSVIKAYRLFLAENYLKKHKVEESDIVSAKRFGLLVKEYSSLRCSLGIFRPDSRRNTTGPFSLENASNLRIALTDGGKTIADIIKDNNLSITREGARQKLRELGIVGSASQRTLLWYSNRLVGLNRSDLASKLTDKEWVISQLAECGGQSGFAARYALSIDSLKSYFNFRLKLRTRLKKRHAEMVELVCTYCGSKFYRPKSIVGREKKRFPNKIKSFCNKICQEKWFHNRSIMNKGLHEKNRSLKTRS
jgi:hypothetical protein